MSLIRRIIKNPIKHVGARIEAKKENIKEDIAKIISKVIVFTVVAFLAILFLIFLSIMLANYLNLVLDSPFWGFGIVAAIYLLLAGIIFSLKDKNFIYKRTREYANWIVKDPDRDIDYRDNH